MSASTFATGRISFKCPPAPPVPSRNLSRTQRLRVRARSAMDASLENLGGGSCRILELLPDCRSTGRNCMRAVGEYHRGELTLTKRRVIPLLSYLRYRDASPSLVIPSSLRLILPSARLTPRLLRAHRCPQPNERAIQPTICAGLEGKAEGRQARPFA
jgi:hypothetical protein